MISENSKIVLSYLKENDGKDVTATDIAAATGLNSRQVNGVATALAKKGLMNRVEAEITNEDGTHDRVKFIVLTDEGKTFNPDEAE